METELEAKWLNIDIEQFRLRLSEIGAKMISSERLMVRRIYDFPDSRLQDSGGWVRLRDEGYKVTLCYKQLNDRTLHGTKEVTVVVDSMENTNVFLESIGLVSKSLQETKRESWKLGDVEIELDTWPWIPSFIEIEANSEQEMKHVAEKLRLNLADALHGSVETAYQAVFDVSEEEIIGMKNIQFSEVPDWLEEKRIKKQNDI
ncbi:CYTH domain-containing protein [Candidatus Saccharibacteria bacterium]|nr:CYTH domain-containing protein [Candidatus Saccharibacteria bacterium]